jgi:guanylate kinase
MGKIFYMMGKSASGKDTIYKRILQECSFLRKIVLYTTRPMRDGETDGKEYHFTSQEKLCSYLEQGKVIEMRTYQTVAGPWSYATVDDGTIDLAHENYLAIGTLESYEKVLAYYGSDYVEPIYITVDDGVRMERALARERQQSHPNYAEMCRRYLADEADFSP